MTENEIIKTEEAAQNAAPADDTAETGGFYTAPKRKTARREAPKSARKRKTGMFTLGLFLILIGVAALAQNLTDGFDILALLKWSPALLVVLGGEILYGSFREGEQYRVNFWCAAMCIVLSAASMCAAFVPTLWDAWGPASQQRAARIEAEFAEKCYEQLKNSGVTYLNGYLSLNGTTHETLDELDSATRFYVEVRLSDYNSREEFISAAMPVVKTVSGLVPPQALKNIDITSRDDGGEVYHLYLNSRWLINAGQDTLLEHVTVTGGIETVEPAAAPEESEAVLTQAPAAGQIAPEGEEAVPETEYKNE